MIDIPDLVAGFLQNQGFSAEGFETKPGIQFAGAIQSSWLKRGEATQLLIILQNALDVPVQGEVTVKLPSSKLFKKTELSTISPVEFSLESTEVEILGIPIKTSMGTPEGKYEVNVKVKGGGGEGGHRVRGKKKGRGYGKALAGSVAESAAISAIGLFFGGVGVRVYTPSDWMKTSFMVKGQDISKATSSLEVVRRKLWSKTHTNIYSEVVAWTSRHMDNWESDAELQRSVASSLAERIDSLLISRGVEIPSEEVLWLGRLVSNVMFWTKQFDFDTHLFTEMSEKEMASVAGELSELDFKEDVVLPWLRSLGEEETIRHFSSVGATMARQHGMAGGRKARGEFFQASMREIARLFKGDSDTSAIKDMINVYLVQAVNIVEGLFPTQKEAIEHLQLLGEAVSAHDDISENRKRTLELIEKKKTQLASC